MVYCTKCGKKNEDDAEYCSKCGTSLTGLAKGTKKSGDRCEEECAIGERSSIAKYFWGVIIIILGIWIVVEFILRKIEDPPEWLAWVIDFNFWWVVGIIIALIFIVTGIRIISKK